MFPQEEAAKDCQKKNLLKFHNKPLIAWSIEAGIKSKYIDKVIVSSDNDKILNVSKDYRSNIIKRPKKFSNDKSKIFHTIKHVLDREKKYDYVVLLQPTSPLRNYKHIDEAIKFLNAKKADAIISVREVNHNPLWCNVLPANKSLVNFIKKKTKGIRSQDLKKFYKINGAIYICKVDKFLKEKGFFLKKSIYAFIMNKASSIDIDDNFDFMFASFLKKNKMK